MANTGNSNPGNFANDRQKASEAGKKGGQGSGGGNFANDKQKATDANKSDAGKDTGKKGGSSGGGGNRKS